jgi:hypothetical protein
MTYNEAKIQIGKSLYCWCNGGNDTETIDGLIKAGCNKEEDREILMKAYRYFENLLAKEIMKAGG